jgi:enterochelin esterase-like enzyme
VIVTPPSYDSATDRRYPVVYVFPGIGGDEWTYLRDVGLESTALKALWTDPAKAPLVVFGNPGDSGGHQQATVVLSEELVGFVDQHYRTRTDANSRSLEGFSLGGATALTLLLHRPDVFGRAVAISSACYLLPNCDALRAGIVAHAKRQPSAKVLLAIGEREIAKNRAINDELAPLLGVEVQVVPNADHDWAAQIATRMRGDVREFGSQIAEFHLAGFALAPTPPR